ncbi:MAG: hypothetical protein EOO68_36000, partial [Moraxellaceae bacterium]
MNIVRIPRSLKNTALLLSFACSSFMLTACGGGDDKKSSSSSSSSISSTSSHAFSSTPVTNPGSGTWPDVKVSASNTRSLKFEWMAAPADTTHYKLFKKADNSSDFAQVGADFTETSITHAVSVHLADWVNSRYKVQACSVAVCTDSSPIVIDSAILSSITYVKAPNAEANDWFGWSVAISADGNTMAVGAPNEASSAVGVNNDQNNNDSPSSGAVYVFVKTSGLWQLQAYLKASNTEQKNDNPELQLPNDRFGYQIALSSDGNSLAVSAINEDSWSEGINCDKNDFTYYASSTSSAYHVQANSGAVYVFKRADGNWTEQAYIKPYYNVPDGAFGSSLAISGDGLTLAIGHVAHPLYLAG